ncbi:uncharacterized protein SPSC_03260 [Sporisorium scitamineum]|uniref:Pep1 n=2 Tax=Sporisorium scitamineum TaxID=49012 RepID=A0A0B5L7L9_9BASI|nr:Pep1 [Sporisorium scitamineum]UFR81799.1 Pep1 [Sporisorium scitamineum]CDS82441.1 uncharacterized protein SPSC_03260 [Sporisorium scitamineum]CDW99443.1 hypothetical protein [Sporisorium scitamineum]
MRTTLTQAILLALAFVLTFTTPSAKASDAIPLPDFKLVQFPMASTFYWYSSVELGVCYSPQARVASVKGALHCTHQEKYDLDNNSWTLPQSCVALKPLGVPLSNAVRQSCVNAKGTFNTIQPAASNTNGGQAYDTIQSKGAGGAGASGSQPDSNDQEDGGKQDGGMLSGLGNLFGK